MTPPRRHAFAAGLLAAGLAVQVAWAVDTVPPPLPAGTPVAQATKPSVSTQAPIRPAQVRTAPATRAESKPTWAELTPPQQQALAPLTGTWRVLGEAHKRKWLALSENFATMPPAEQSRLHSRMTEWAALSPQQRTLARLNFAEAQKVDPATDKRAKWEAYQALPAEEKRKLAAAAAKTPAPPTAAAVKPVPQQKLAKIPKKKAESAKIAVLPGQVDNNTLLPQPLAPILP